MQNNTNLASISLDNLEHVTGGVHDPDPDSRPDDGGVGVLSQAPCYPQSSPQQAKPPAPHPSPLPSPKWILL